MCLEGSNSLFKEHDTWEKFTNWVPTFSLINFFYKLEFHSKESGYVSYKQIQWTTSRLPLLKQKHSLELQDLLTQRKSTGEKHFNHFFEFLFFYRNMWFRLRFGHFSYNWDGDYVEGIEARTFTEILKQFWTPKFTTFWTETCYP